MTIASGDLSIAICQRCGLQYPYKELRADGNTPSLRVCNECWDHYDPWRLAPPQPDPLQLRWPRPDVPLNVPDDPLENIIESETP